MAAKKKRGGKGRGARSARSALALSLVAEALSLAVFWLVVGNLAAMVSVWRPLIWVGLAGCLVGWATFRFLAASSSGRGWILLAWLLYLALAAAELRLLSSGALSSFPLGSG